jgi:hypothetical protein
MIKLINLLKENNKILIPRRSTEERQKNYAIATQKKIQQYIKDGSQGDLDLTRTPITSLPSGLNVGGNLYLRNTPIFKKYTKEEIKQIVPGVEGNIYL